MLPYDFFNNVEQELRYMKYGDTDSCYINIPELKPKSSEEAVKLSYEVSKEINQVIKYFYDNELLPKLGVSPEYNTIDFKTEFVFDRLMLLDIKKNYAYRLLAKEGKILKESEIKYVGLPIIRSDYCELNRLFLKKMIDEVAMNSYSYDEALKKLNELAKDAQTQMLNAISTSEYHLIGRPCKWSGKEYDTDPYQVISMKLYNTLIDEAVFMPMSAGVYIPIKLLNVSKFETLMSPIRNKNKYYLEDIPTVKLNNLAVPYKYDNMKLKQILETLNIIVDEEKCWENVYNTSCQRVVSVIKKSAQK